VQYVNSIHAQSGFVPLLALQDAQHLAMFSRVTIVASLTMCSDVPNAATGIATQVA